MDNIFQVTNIVPLQERDKRTISIVCPICGHKGTFKSLIDDPDVVDKPQARRYLRRLCPNSTCNSLIFVIVNSVNEIFTFPSNVISFDKENIPDKVLNAFEEAVTCHSNQCYIASGIMIRKTLEVLCLDKGANGSNLFQKLTNLAQTIMIPQELKDAMQDIRLLGNDAAHVEAQTYDQVSKEEIEISIEFTKEILKAIYQYDSLLQKLRSLKRPPANP